MCVSVKLQNALLRKAVLFEHIYQLSTNSISGISGHVSGFDYDVDVTNTVASIDRYVARSRTGGARNFAAQTEAKATVSSGDFSKMKTFQVCRISDVCPIIRPVGD